MKPPKYVLYYGTSTADPGRRNGVPAGALASPDLNTASAAAVRAASTLGGKPVVLVLDTKPGPTVLKDGKRFCKTLKQSSPVHEYLAPPGAITKHPGGRIEWTEKTTS